MIFFILPPAKRTSDLRRTPPPPAPAPRPAQTALTPRGNDPNPVPMSSPVECRCCSTAKYHCWKLSDRWGELGMSKLCELGPGRNAAMRTKLGPTRCSRLRDCCIPGYAMGGGGVKSSQQSSFCRWRAQRLEEPQVVSCGTLQIPARTARRGFFADIYSGYREHKWSWARAAHRFL